MILFIFRDLTVQVNCILDTTHYEKIIITTKFSKRFLNHKVVKLVLSCWHHRYHSEDGIIVHCENSNLPCSSPLVDATVSIKKRGAGVD